MHEKENKFIQKLIDTKAQVTVYLINGIKLSGVITAGNHSAKVKDTFEDFTGPQIISLLYTSPSQRARG